MCYRCDGRRPVTRKNDKIKSLLAQRPRHRDGVWTQSLADGDGRNLAVVSEGDEGGVAVARGMHILRDPTETAAAEPRFFVGDEDAHALSGLLDGTRIGAGFACQVAKRGCQRM